MSTDPNESHDPYVEVRDGQFYVRGSDVRLERLILAWSRVPAPEALRGQFPSLSMAAIYGAIAYALGHKDELDRLTAEYQQKHPEERAAGRWIGTQAHRVEGGEIPHDEDGTLFDHFTERARKVVGLAREEAQRLNHNYIGTEHLLLGLVREGDGVAARVLESLGVNLDKVRTQTIQVLSQSGGTHGSPAGKLAAATTIQSGARGVSDRDRFDKFDAGARKTLMLAQEEAQRFNHNYIGTEHLLLGLVKDGDSTAAKVLQRMDVGLSAVRSAIEHIIGRGDRIVLGDIGLTPRSKKVIELAVDEARRRNAHYIGTEHLLLGTIREGEGIAGGVLESLGVTYDRAKAATDEVLREQDGQEE